MAKQANLIFLISQPRAGSTLTQKILGNHPKIYTASEPWLMLHPLYALKKNGYEAEYNSYWARSGLESFLELMPNQKQTYFDAVAQNYGSLYARVLEKENKEYFLDKTPRYYNIIPELYHTFPNAKFIILLRNPLAVLCSIINTWVKDRWLGLRTFNHDLLHAPRLLVEGINYLGDKAIVLRYEEILGNPEQVFRDAFGKMNLDFSADLLNYGNTNSQKWRLGDSTKVYQYDQADSQNIDRWITSLKTPQVWRLAKEYLDFLESGTLQSMGYNTCELQQYLEDSHPGFLRLWNTMPLDWVLKEPHEFGHWDYGYYPVRLVNALQRKGLGGTGVEFIHKLARTLSAASKLPQK